MRFDVFLSHTSADKDAVESIAKCLHADHGLQPFLDRWHLIPGEPWQENLEVALNESSTCAVFVGPLGIGPWENEEMRAALAERVERPTFRVIPVLLPGASMPARGRLPRFLRRLTWVDFRGGLEAPGPIHRLVCGVRGLPPGPSDEPREPAPSDVCPYRGLQMFEESHVDFFFGREALTQWLVEALRDSRFLAVIGPSGSGKSSLVRAGLIPALRAGAIPGSDAWPVLVTTPGSHPNEALATQLVQHLDEGADSVSAMLGLQDSLRDDERALHAKVQLALADQSDRSHVLCVIDQFEELFTLCTDEAERQSFLDNLLHATEVALGRTVVVITMRADFYNRAATYAALADRLSDDQVLVAPMSSTELREAIERPAQRVGLEFETGLVETILEDVAGKPGSLPLLEHALLELWQRRDKGMLTLAAYRDIGGVAGAIADRAEYTYRHLTPSQQETTRRILMRLVRPGEGSEDTRRRAYLSELWSDREHAPLVEEVVKRLADAHLVVTGRDPASRQELVDVAHEALIRGWPRLRHWIEEDRAALRTHLQLGERAREWIRLDRDAGSLLRGAQLAEAQEWAAAHENEMNMEERELLEASLALQRSEAEEREAHRQHELETARRLAEEAEKRRRAEEERAQEAELRGHEQEATNRSLRRYNRALAAATAVIVFALLVAVFQYSAARREQANALASAAAEVDAKEAAERSRDEARKQRDIALRNQSLFQAELARRETRAGNTTAGIRLALAALPEIAGSLATPYVPEAEAALYEAIHAHRELATLEGHTDTVWHLEYSPDGSRIVTASADRTARVWDAETGETLAVLRGHGDQVWHATFSPDGQRVATAGSWDNTARIWDATSGAQLAELTVMKGVRRVAFTADGERLAVVASGNRWVHVWRMASEESPRVMRGHRKGIEFAALSPNRDRLITTAYGDSARIWDLSSGVATPAVLGGDEMRASKAAFSPDGRRVVTAGGFDAKARLWDASSGAEQLVLSGHRGHVNTARFSPDGRRVITGSSDNTARVWDAQSGGTLAVLYGHERAVQFAAFTPDGAHVVTASYDGSARLWDIESGGALVAVLHGHEQGIASAALSPDGRRLVTGSYDGTARIWDIGSGPAVTVFKVHDGAPTYAAFNHDGRRLAIATREGPVHVWNTETGEPVAVLLGHEKAVYHVVFSPDGTLIASASGDKTVRLWREENGEPVATLGGPKIHDGGATLATFSPRGDVVLTVGNFDDVAHLWDVATGQRLAVLGEHRGRVEYAAFSPDGERIVTASKDGTAKIWRASDRVVTATLTGHEAAVMSAFFSRDGRRVLTASRDKTVRLWDAQTGRELQVFGGHEDGVWYADLSPNGRRVVTAVWAGSTLRLWDAQTGAELAVIRSKEQRKKYLPSFSPQGNRFVAAWTDNTARVWDADSGAEVAVLAGHHRGVELAAFSPKGDQVVTVSSDGTARLWKFFPTTRQLTDYARGLLPHQSGQ